MSLIKSVIISPNNIKKICRVCLEQKTNQLSLFTSIQFEDERIVPTSIPDILVQLTSEIVSGNYNQI